MSRTMCPRFLSRLGGLARMSGLFCAQEVEGTYAARSLLHLSRNFRGMQVPTILAHPNSRRERLFNLVACMYATIRHLVVAPVNAYEQ